MVGPTREVSSAVDRAIIGTSGYVQFYAHPVPGGEVNSTREPYSARHHPGRTTPESHVYENSVPHHDLAGGVTDV